MKAKIEGNKVLVDGKDFRILSGEMHYFRIHQDTWRNRLEKMKACGLNTVATYMPWNLHERTEGIFDFSGMLDVKRYLKTAEEVGLKVILRPGPYICSEWEFGGFPAWLLKNPGIRLRCSDPVYMEAVTRYFLRVFEEVREFFDRNLIALQIENGYASYGNDMIYYNYLKQLVDESGYQNLVIAADGDSDTRIANNVPDGVWKTLMCGVNPIPQLELMNKQQPGPQMLIEFWSGNAIRHNGVSLRFQDPGELAGSLDQALSWGAHVNFYMFGGGTNFGFTAGAMHHLNGNYQQQVSCYDARAALNESGDTTEKYFKFREVLAKYNPDFDPAIPIPPNSEKCAYGNVEFTKFAPLANNLDTLSEKTVESPVTLTMEEIGGDFGFVRYSTYLEQQSFKMPIRIYDFKDRAWVFFDGKLIPHNDGRFTVDTTQGSGQLEIIVENMSRTCFYCNIEENKKGILRGVLLNNQQFQHGWKISHMPMEDLSGLAYKPIPEQKSLPGFFRGTFNIDNVCDTFLEVPYGQRGFVLINGFNIGRYDNIGPQFTSYVPAGILKQGENTIELMEYETMRKPAVRFISHARCEP